MNISKDKLRFYIVVLLLMMIVFASCKDEVKTTTVEEMATEASKEFCDCLKNNSIQKCEEELNFRYKSLADDDRFISEFNKVNTCGVTIHRKNNKSLKSINKEKDSINRFDYPDGNIMVEEPCNLFK